VPVGGDVGGVLDLGLGVADAHVVAFDVCSFQGCEGFAGAEESGVDSDPAGVAGVVIDVDLADGADLVAVVVNNLAAGFEDLGDMVLGNHGVLLYLWCCVGEIASMLIARLPYNFSAVTKSRPLKLAPAVVGF
jgi:hypothetical protein